MAHCIYKFVYESNEILIKRRKSNLFSFVERFKMGSLLILSKRLMSW